MSLEDCSKAYKLVHPDTTAFWYVFDIKGEPSGCSVSSGVGAYNIPEPVKFVFNAHLYDSATGTFAADAHVHAFGKGYFEDAQGAIFGTIPMCLTYELPPSPPPDGRRLSATATPAPPPPPQSPQPLPQPGSSTYAVATEPSFCGDVRPTNGTASHWMTVEDCTRAYKEVYPTTAAHWHVFNQAKKPPGCARGTKYKNGRPGPSAFVFNAWGYKSETGAWHPSVQAYAAKGEWEDGEGNSIIAFPLCKTREVPPSPPSSDRRLFEAPTKATREDEDDEALLWMSHPIGNNGRREPSSTPTPTPTPEPPSDSEYAWGDDPDAWWNHLEVSRRAHELYARRVLPEAHGRSAAASVALAITLAHPNRSVMVGQTATLYAMCGALGGCEQGDYWTSIHDRDDADVTEDTPDPQHLPIDDAGWALQLLSRAVEPAVHAVVEGMLVCLAPALCTSHCDVCNEWVGMGNATAEQVLRETELRLHTSIRQQSRSVLDCVASFECLSEVANEVAEVLGTARELPATVRMETVAKANAELLEGARAEARQNASWQVRRPARFALLREHIAAVRAHEQTPLGEDDEAAEAGRRLAERPPPSPPPLTPMQEMMKLRTNETCRQLALKNSTAAHDSHVQATHLWMVRPPLNPNPRNTRAHN